jgi:transposase
VAVTDLASLRGLAHGTVELPLRLFWTSPGCSFDLDIPFMRRWLYHRIRDCHVRGQGQPGDPSRDRHVPDRCQRLPAAAALWAAVAGPGLGGEGANGIGRPLAQRLVAAGERVLDVPAKLAARARVFDTGQGRKTDAADAHAIVMVALRDRGLREVSSDSELAVLRLLCDRRDELSKASAQALNRMAAEELGDIDRLDAKLKAMKAELKEAVLATGSHLMDIHGIGPAGAARILADVGDVARFPDRGHFASWTGTAPIDASSGQHIRHRL